MRWFAILATVTLAVIAFVLWPNPSAPAIPSGPVLQLSACTSEDGSGDAKPCMWHGPDSPNGGLTVINFADGSWCYPTESVRGVWTNCVQEK